MEIKKGQIIKFKWIDAFRFSNIWYYFSDINYELENNKELYAIGFFVEETEDFIVIAQHYDNINDIFGNLFAIPKKCIKSLTIIN